MYDVYVAKKDCGHIAAAFPARSSKETAEIAKQMINSGYTLELTSSADVRCMFDLHCDCSKPPTIPGLFDDMKVEIKTFNNTYDPIIHDEGVDQADIDAAATEPQTEDAEEAA